MLRLTGALRQKTDYDRWADPRSIYASWESRTEMAAALVPNHSRVIEFGAATRVLERFLDPSCTYTASDLVDRGPGTIVCDLNERPLPELGADSYDVAVIMGVLEYVRDVPSVLDWLTNHFPLCVLSYACTRTTGNRLRSRLETIGRLNHGWMNSYCADELRTLFDERGFVLQRDEPWKDQRVFVFSQQNG
ncbi:class I SAM-dependent methyltransferase [Mycobacterium sp. NPDC048908]|uniref:class I SAM-dependent methyltransferase n=1 Tax=Mycobacterium sp. NPDC048908 TaxID=3364292 RepID=UPI00371EDC46